MPIIGVIASSAKGAPGVPTSVSATNVGSGRAFNNGRADVSFTPGAGATATSFTVTSSPGGFTGTGASSPISVTGLQSNTAYTFTVTATNAAGTSNPSAASNSITATTVPQAPTIGTATDGGTGSTVSVAFTANATGGSAITGFTATSSPGSITGTGGASPITVSGLTAGTAYTFTVTATNVNGTSAPSAASNSVTPAVPTAYDSIATIIPSGTSTVTFSSIPQGYKHLQIRMTGRNDSGNFGASAVRMRFNQDASSIYTWHRLSNSAANALTNVTEIILPDPIAEGGNNGGVVGVGIIDIIDYSSTTKLKTVKSITAFNAAGNNSMTILSGQWRNTSGINTIVFINSNGAFTSETQFALYGIKG